MYKAIVLEHELTNSKLELFDMMTLKKQLKEFEFIVGRQTKRFGNATFSKTASAHCFKKNSTNFLLDNFE
ncbi:MAG: hypothetical protein ACRCSK_09220 [Fusobacteriaceae bacterium]